MWSVRKGVAHWGNLPTSLGLTGPTLGQWKDKSSVRCEHARVMLYHCTQVTTPFQPAHPCTSEFSHARALIEGWTSCIAAPCCPSQHPTPGRIPGDESTDDPFSQIQTRPWCRRASHLAVRHLWTEERLSQEWSPFSFLLRRASSLSLQTIQGLPEWLPSWIFHRVTCQNKTDSQKRYSSAFWIHWYIGATNQVEFPLH